MKRHVAERFRAQPRSVAITALSVVAALANGPGARAETAHLQEASAITAAHSTTASKNETVSGIDALILHLHDSLKITAAQEPLWERVAAVMRDNASTMTQLARSRAEGARQRTAVDDLKSYAEVSAAHADGTKKLIPVFETLYGSMSAEQKRAADAEFREHHQGHRP